MAEPARNKVKIMTNPGRIGQKRSEFARDDFCFSPAAPGRPGGRPLRGGLAFCPFARDFHKPGSPRRAGTSRRPYGRTDLLTRRERSLDRSAVSPTQVRGAMRASRPTRNQRESRRNPPTAALRETAAATSLLRKGGKTGGKVAASTAGPRFALNRRPINDRPYGVRVNRLRRQGYRSYGLSTH